MPSKVTEFATGAIKETGGKPPIALVPPELILAAAEAFGYGAQKYSAHNYRKGLPVSEIYSALQRHLLAFIGGEDRASDSGLPHLSHAAACVGMLITILKEHPDMDDRYNK
jgi:Domain of unknown function (DUF5664)